MQNVLYLENRPTFLHKSSPWKAKKLIQRLKYTNYHENVGDMPIFKHMRYKFERVKK